MHCNPSVRLSCSRWHRWCLDRLLTIAPRQWKKTSRTIFIFSLSTTLTCDLLTSRFLHQPVTSGVTSAPNEFSKIFQFSEHGRQTDMQAVSWKFCISASNIYPLICVEMENHFAFALSRRCARKTVFTFWFLYLLIQKLLLTGVIIAANFNFLRFCNFDKNRREADSRSGCNA